MKPQADITFVSHEQKHRNLCNENKHNQDHGGIINSNQDSISVVAVVWLLVSLTEPMQLLVAGGSVDKKHRTNDNH